MGRPRKITNKPRFYRENNLRKYLRKNGVSERALANHVGCSSVYIYDIERGWHEPGLLTAQKISTFFDVEIEDIFPEYDYQSHKPCRKVFEERRG